MNKCQPIALGVAIGTLWAFYVFGAAIIAMWGWSADLVKVFSSLYIGYNASVLGAIIGGVWAFCDGFLAGVIIAWVYNKVAK